MINKSTRRSLFALAGASLGTAAVAVAPTATFAATPHAAASDPTGNAATKPNVKPASTAFRPTASANSVAGDCTSSTFLGLSDGSLLVVPSLSNGDPNCSLRNGDSGAPVIKLQQALNQCHNQSLSVDGAFGPLTAGAVSSVQHSKSLPATGIYGPALGVRMSWPDYIVNSAGTLVNTGACAVPGT